MTDQPERAPLMMSAEREHRDRRIVDEDRWEVETGDIYNALERAFDEIDALRAALAEAERERDEARHQLVTQQYALEFKDKQNAALTARVAELMGALRLVRADLYPGGWTELGKPYPIERYGITADGCRGIVEYIDQALAGEAP